VVWYQVIIYQCAEWRRSQWPRGLRRRSGRLVAGVASLNPTLGMDVCLFCLYVVLSCVCRGLCDGLIARPEESYRVSNCMCDHRNPERGPLFQVGNDWMNELINVQSDSVTKHASGGTWYIDGHLIHNPWDRLRNFEDSVKTGPKEASCEGLNWIQLRWCSHWQRLCWAF
jgi:hypothetical protein